MLRTILLRLFAAFLVALAPLASAAQETATPALWHVRGARGEAYLFGSIHVLPPGIDWRTDEVKRAMARADVFVFELPADGGTMTRMQQLVAAHGFLPPGESLRAKLAPDEQTEFDAALAAAGLPLAAVDRARPWLAGLQITFARLAKEGYDAASGVDLQIQRESASKEQRFLETVDQQFALLAPTDETLELNEFRSSLKDIAGPGGDLAELVAAWRKGDTAALDRLMNDDLSDFPDARAALLDGRNRAWVRQIRTMLKQRHVFFITVGAGHLVGPGGVPALLRKTGFRVTGP